MRTFSLILATLILAISTLGWQHVRTSIEHIAQREGQWAAAEKALQSLPEHFLASTTSSVKVPIFIYHHIRPYVEGESAIQDQYDVTPEFFETQMKYLHDNGYTTISLDDLTKAIALGTTSPVTKPVILTFDDGWRNQYTYAFPILKKYNFTGTFYIYSVPIGNRIYLTWDELREMDSAGMTIGSHSLTHPLFRDIPDGEVLRQIRDSKKIIEAELQKPVRHFAAPYGYTNHSIETMIKESGYSTGRSVYRGAYHTNDSLYRLNGYFVNDNLNNFISTLIK